jgi:hypothetical protein
LYFYIAFQRLAGSMNPSDFKTDRFSADYFGRRFEPQFKEKRTQESMIRLSMGIPLQGPMPSFEELRARISPDPQSAGGAFMVKYADWYQNHAPLVSRVKGENGKPARAGLTGLGWWLIGGCLLSLLGAYRRGLGVWTLVVISALVATFLVGIQNHRYFAPSWPFVVVLLALPLDVLVRSVCCFRKRC